MCFIETVMVFVELPKGNLWEYIGNFMDAIRKLENNFSKTYEWRYRYFMQNMVCMSSFSSSMIKG